MNARIRAESRARTGERSEQREGGGEGLNPCLADIPEQREGMAVRQGFEPWEEVKAPSTV